MLRFRHSPEPSGRSEYSSGDIRIEPASLHSQYRLRPEPEETLNVLRLVAAARRQKWFLVASLAGSLIVGLAYLQIAQPLYTATARLLAVGEAQLVGGGTDASQAAVDAVRVDTQVELLAADITLDAVLQALSPDQKAALRQDAELAGLRQAASGDTNLSELETLRRNLSVSRLERTYVFLVSYRSASAPLAADVANAFGFAFIDNQRKVQEEGTRQALAQLQARSVNLAQEIAAVEQQSAHIFRGGRSTDQALVAKRELDFRAEQLRTELEGVSLRLQAMARYPVGVVAAGRMIVAATEPDKPTRPRKSMVLLLSVAAGLLLGAGIAGIRELLDVSFRTAQSVRSTLGLPFIGFLPHLRRKPPSKAVAQSIPREMRYAIDHPKSRFADTLRAAYVAIAERSEKGAVVGVGSVLPREGKTTVAANLATLLASEGLSVLLVDGNLRRSDLSSRFVADANPALQRHHMSVSLLLRFQTGQLHFLCLNSGDSHSGTAALRPAEIATSFEKLCSEYDLVVVDIPTVDSCAEARAIMAALEHVLLVVRWGQTSRHIVARKLANSPQLHHRIVGVLLNDVNFNSLSSFEESDAVREKMFSGEFTEVATPPLFMDPHAPASS
ncbi:nucleotide-binding protein [Pseudoroseomonas sp. WGS1072]|uniref:nucleotide-binding protein n=1 Tax=Roseomonas sp. WGS1072 TaxID=3366816 RepID=UPI003BF35074